MKAKATHFGECQICGSRQKLPNGKLAKHGYMVQSFFVGTCQGSGHDPYEKSTDRIQNAMQMAKERIWSLKKEIQEQEDKTGPLYAQIHLGYNYRFYQGYFWLPAVRITEDARIVFKHPMKQTEETYNRIG